MKKIITSIEEIEGKTVKKASFVNLDELLVLAFSDDTFAFVESNNEQELFFESDIGIDTLLRVGVMSKDEFEAIRLKNVENNLERDKARDLKEFERLNKIYGNKQTTN